MQEIGFDADVLKAQSSSGKNDKMYGMGLTATTKPTRHIHSLILIYALNKL